MALIMPYTNTLLAILLLILDKVQSIPVLSDVDRADGVVVRTVHWGATVILKCMSNDKGHNFQYWHLVNKGLIIGPANVYDLAKFRYEILSGNLTIKSVSEQEEGLYECVSRAVNGEDMNIMVVRMVVQKDLEYVPEHDYHINVIRVLIAAITLVLLSMGGWFVYRIWKDRYRFPSYLQNEDDDDDDDTEEIFSQPSTSKANLSVNNIVPSKTKPSIVEHPFSDVDISTDFKSILDTANDK